MFMRFGIILMVMFIIAPPIFFNIEPTEIKVEFYYEYSWSNMLSVDIFHSDLRNIITDYTGGQQQNFYYNLNETRTYSFEGGLNILEWQYRWAIPQNGSLLINYEVASKEKEFAGNKNATIDSEPEWTKRYPSNVNLKLDGITYKIINSDAVYNLTKNVIGNETRIYYQSKLIYEWIINNIKYKSNTNILPASQENLLITKEGDCDDMSFLFVAMARSIGIPAYTIEGLIIRETGNIQTMHTWVGVIIPSDTGIFDVLFLDPANKFFDRIPAYIISTSFDTGDPEYFQCIYRSFSYSFDRKNPGEAIISIVCTSYKQKTI